MRSSRSSRVSWKVGLFPAKAAKLRRRLAIASSYHNYSTTSLPTCPTHSKRIPMASILKPPAPLPSENRGPSVFLAGSIEMGAAEDWQAIVQRGLDDLEVLVLNPRRDDWNASWVQSISDPRFREQVEWELSGLEQ